MGGEEGGIGKGVSKGKIRGIVEMVGMGGV